MADQKKGLGGIAKRWFDAKKTELLTTNNRARENAAYEQEMAERDMKAKAGEEVVLGLFPGLRKFKERQEQARSEAEERSLEEQRERARRAELDEAENRLRLETAVEMCRRDLDCEPDVAIGTVAPPLPEGVSANGRARELERELRLMGPINPLALQEFESSANSVLAVSRQPKRDQAAERDCIRAKSERRGDVASSADA